MAGEIPSARLSVLAGVGHMTAIEAPDETASHILEFIS